VAGIAEAAARYCLKIVDLLPGSTLMTFDQSEYEVRCEWGYKGLSILAPISDVVVIVDVLSFSTSLEIATSQGALVYPYRWMDGTAHEFAASVSAEVADRLNKNGYSLSPASLRNLPPCCRLVLPSPNGSELSLSAGSAVTVSGCLRNCRAVAEYAMRRGTRVAVIPAGEKWEDGTLRPCFEDLIGAGAVIRHLLGTLSPEARAARDVFENNSSVLRQCIAGCSSGKEKVMRGEETDVTLASELNVSSCVPVMVDGAYREES
jgi:2-phosphosulfolactate phosphatase